MEGRLRLNAILEEARKRQRRAEGSASGSRERLAALLAQHAKALSVEQKEYSEEEIEEIIRSIKARCQQLKREHFRLTSRYW